jgi:sigma-B regulation protein RsbU (phosphoserine phosphatase)
VKACLKATSLPLGVTADIEFPSQGTYVLEPGDVLVLVTDGVMEAASPSGEEFGAERMLSVLCSSRRLGAREIISSLHQVVCTFTHPGRATDDMTLVVVKRYPGSDDRPRRRVRGAGPRRRTNR